MPRTIESYRREQAILNKVLGEKTGLLARFSSHNEAKIFRANCYAFRKLDRDLQSEAYEVGDPRRGTSPYDMIRFTDESAPKKGIYAIKMVNCETLLQVHGIEELLSLDSGEAIDLDEELAPAPKTEAPPSVDDSFEDEFAAAVAQAEAKT